MDTTSKPLAATALIYLRISEDRTGEEAGVDRQREDCERRCRERGWSVLDVLSDNDASAKAGAKQRPGFEAMLTRLERGEASVVVAWHLDRVQRSRRDEVRLYEVCQRHDITVSLVRGPDLEWRTPTGRYLADNLGSLARMEIEIKSDRQKRAVKQAVAAGKRVGGRKPFGYDADGMTVREREAQAVRDGYDMLLSGVPLARIAADWNAAGHRTGQVGHKSAEFGLWRAGSVRDVLLNPRYCGLRAHAPVPEHGRRRYWEKPGGDTENWRPAQWPALVGEETWRSAVALLSDPTRRTPPLSPGRALLTGIGLCGHEDCGATVHGGRTRAGARTYRCSGALGHVSRAAAPVDEWVGACVVARLSRPDAAELLVDTEAPDLPALRSEAMALRTRLDQLAELLADGTLTPSSAREASARLRAALADIEQRMTSAARVDVLGPLVSAQDVERTWLELGVDLQRAVVSALARVTVMPPGRGVRVFKPESVVITWRQPVE